MQLNENNFYKIYLNLIKQITNNNIRTIWIGFSGGLDSSVLLYLSNLIFNNNYNLNALHINHNVNKNAKIWQQHCYNICKQLNINFYCAEVQADPKQTKELGLEAALRIARQKIWQKFIKTNEYLLLAHHLNDQAETLFLRLLRGAGLTGISAIHPIAKLGDINIIRPLLYFTKQELANFAQQHNINYIIDPSNNNINFTRNFLRHKIMPIIQHKWPEYLNNINRTIGHLQKSDQFIKMQANIALLQCYKNSKVNNILLIDQLLKFDSFLQTEILRLFITKQKFHAPDTEKLNKIYTEIIAAKKDRQPQLNLKQYVIYRYRNQLYVYSTEFIKNQQLNRKYFGFKTKLEDLDIYFGDYIQDIGMQQAKKIFQKKGIPPWQRKDYPLVFQQGKLIAIIGLWVK